MLDTGYRGLGVGHRIQRGECLTQDTEGRVLGTGHREVSV